MRNKHPFYDWDISDREGEIWVDVSGYDGIYLVSNHGRFKTVPREINNGRRLYVSKERIMRQKYATKNGSVYITLQYNKNKVTKLVTTVVTTSFGMYRNNGYVFSHLDNDPKNNALSNLLQLSQVDVHKNHREKGLDRCRKRPGIVIEYNGVTKDINHWADINGVLASTIRARLRKGMPGKLAIQRNPYTTLDK